MQIAETERLIVRTLTPGDAAFMCRLLNEPAWIENIGDRGVRTPAEAEGYIREKLVPSYATHGYGMYALETRADRGTIGICGLVRRDALPGPDLGFALLSEWWGRGFAFEGASAVLAHARETLRLPPLLAITTPGNTRSGKLLEKLGFEFQRLIRLTPEADATKLYAERRRDADGSR